MEKIRIRDQGTRMEKIWIQNPGSGMEKNRIRDPGSGINILDQQNWKSRRQICQDLKNRVIIEPFVEKAFWYETKSFLQSKAASLALKRGKTPVNWIFHSPTRHGRRPPTTSPGAKPLLQPTFKRPQHRFRVVFGLKRPSMPVQNLFFARPTPEKPSPPLYSITSCEKRHQDVLPAPFFAIFHTSDLLSLPENEIRAGKLLFDPGHPQEELVGGRPPPSLHKSSPPPSQGRQSAAKKHTYC